MVKHLINIFWSCLALLACQSIRKAPKVSFQLESKASIFSLDSGKMSEIKRLINVRVVDTLWLFEEQVDMLDEVGRLRLQVPFATMVTPNLKYGLRFEDLSVKKPKISKIDAEAYLINTSFQASEMEATYGQNIGTFYKTIKYNDKSKDVYIKQTQYDSVDSIYYYYDPSMKNLPFSFSPKKDSISRSKLIKIEYVQGRIKKGKFDPRQAIPTQYFVKSMIILNPSKTSYDDGKLIKIFKKHAMDSLKLICRIESNSKAGFQGLN